MFDHFGENLTAETTSSFALIGSNGGQQIHPVWIHVGRCGKEKCAHAAYLRPSIAWFYVLPWDLEPGEGRSFSDYHRGLVPSRWYKVSNIRHKHHWGYPHTSVRSYSRWHVPLRKTCIFFGGRRASKVPVDFSSFQPLRGPVPHLHLPTILLQLFQWHLLAEWRKIGLATWMLNTFWSYKSREICRKHFDNHALKFNETETNIIFDFR